MSEHNFQIKPEHHIEVAFQCGGKKFWKFTGTINMPPEKALDALPIYEEMDSRVDRKFLLEHTKAVDKILTDPKKINVFDIKKLNDQMKERLEMVFYPYAVKKLASILYFDESENPYKWDESYAHQKIAFWDKHMGDNFFLSEPVKSLIPYSNLSVDDILLFLKISKQINHEHLETISTVLSPGQRNKDLFRQPSFTPVTDTPVLP